MRARTVLALKNANKFLIKVGPKFILSANFEGKFKFEDAKRIYFSQKNLGGHVVRAKPSAQTIKSGKNVKKSWILGKITISEGHL